MRNTVAGHLGFDPTLPDVTIVIGGQERQLCFDYNAIALVEKQTGLNLLAGAASVQSATSLRAMLWASLLKQSPDLTIEEVGGWITMRNASGIYAALLACWFASNEDDGDDKGGEQPQGEAPAQAKTSA